MTLQQIEAFISVVENRTLDWGITIGGYQSLYADALQVAEEMASVLSSLEGVRLCV